MVLCELYQRPQAKGVFLRLFSSQHEWEKASSRNSWQLAFALRIVWWLTIHRVVSTWMWGFYSQASNKSTSTSQISSHQTYISCREHSATTWCMGPCRHNHSNFSIAGAHVPSESARLFYLSRRALLSQCMFHWPFECSLLQHVLSFVPGQRCWLLLAQRRFLLFQDSPWSAWECRLKLHGWIGVHSASW